MRIIIQSATNICIDISVKRNIIAHLCFDIVLFDSMV